MRKDVTRQREFVYRGFGFPVILLNVPMVRVRGEWTPDVNYAALQRRLLAMLVEKPARLTGDEVRFIRLAHDMTVAAFAQRFAVTHPAVLKWQAAGVSPTEMVWSTEKDVRLFILTQLHAAPRKFARAYQQLQTAPAKKPTRLRIDVA